MTSRPAVPPRRPMASLTPLGAPNEPPPLPLLHPLVRAAQRAAELAAIAAHVSSPGVTRCPTRFCAPSLHAVVVPAPSDAPTLDAKLDTVADAARWLRHTGHPGFTVLRPGLYHRLGRLLDADGVLATVRRLQARRLGIAAAPSAGTVPR